jgi:pseudaminic acid synthase
VTKAFKIGRYSVGEGQAPFIIAEMSGNHNQSLDRALAIVDAVAKSGAHALKIQTYTADTMTLDLDTRDFMITDTKSLWKGDSLYNLYKRAYTPWEWHKAIFNRCKKHRLIGFSTPFDPTAVDFLEKFDVPLYKIASFENVDLELIKKVAKTGKPVIISTGLADEREIRDAVKTARQAGCKNLVLLKCTSAYPASPEGANLATIGDMRKKFGCPIGLSDHTLGLGVSLASVAYGAVAIERHVTLSRKHGGVDAPFSLEPDELRSLVVESKSAWEAQGRVAYGPSPKEAISLRFRRSLYATRDIAPGETLSDDNVRAIRPGYGMHPRHYQEVLGCRAKRYMQKGSRLRWEYLT